MHAPPWTASRGDARGPGDIDVAGTVDLDGRFCRTGGSTVVQQGHTRVETEAGGRRGGYCARHYAYGVRREGRDSNDRATLPDGPPCHACPSVRLCFRASRAGSGGRKTVCSRSLNVGTGCAKRSGCAQSWAGSRGNALRDGACVSPGSIVRILRRAGESSALRPSLRGAIAQPGAADPEPRGLRCTRHC